MNASYAIQRRSRPLICLTPLIEATNVERLQSDEEVVLKSSTLLTKRQSDEVTFALYNTIDYSVDRWIQDKQYVPRFLASALAFTVSYFIFSLAVRDPIPMVDELVISSVLAVVTWRAIARRDSRSSVAQHRRHELKVRASDRRVVIVDELFALEQYLDDVESQDVFMVANALCGVGGATLPALQHALDDQTVMEIHSLLMAHLKLHDKELFDLIAKVRQNRRRESSSAKLASQLYQKAMNKALDLALIALALALTP